MEGIQTSKNYEMQGIESLDEVDLKPSVRTSIEKNIKKVPFIVLQTLPLFLSSHNLYICSPAATGKSELKSIAIHQMIAEPINSLQVLIITQLDYLVKEMCHTLQLFSPESNLNIGFCDHSTDIKSDTKTFETNQIVVTITKKCSIVLKRYKKKFPHLRFIILDVFDPNFQMNQDILANLNIKSPLAKYWIFSKMCERTLSEEEYFNNRFANLFVFKLLKNHQDIQALSHHFILADSDEEKVYYIKKILEFNNQCQKVIFYHPQKEPELYLESLRQYCSFHLVNHSDRVDVIENFNKEMFDILITPGKQVFSRKVKSQGNLYVIITDVQDQDTYETLCRRGGSQTNDRIFSIVNGNDELEKITQISNYFNIQLTRWPNNNDD